MAIPRLPLLRTGGKRVAYLEELLFIPVPVPDVAVRLAGVESGSYHYSQTIKQDQYDRVLTLRSVEPRIGSPSFSASAVLNHKHGLMTSKKLRQAFQAALDMEPILAAAVGHSLFYRLDPGLAPAEAVLWHSGIAKAHCGLKSKDTFDLDNPWFSRNPPLHFSLAVFEAVEISSSRVLESSG